MKLHYFSIIIITLNEEKNIPLLLEDLQQQSYQNFEVLVVDSNSTDNTQQIATKYKKYFQDFDFINMKTKGISLGRNTGAKKAKYEDLIFLDADTRLQKNFLEKLNTYLYKHPKTDAGTFLIDKNKERVIYNLGNNLINIGNKIMNPLYPTCIGACLYSKKNVFNAVGGFDETISLGEDSSFSINVNKKGFKFVIIPIPFRFNARRFQEEGIFKVLGKYLLSSFYLLKGIKPDSKVKYDFNHYKK